MLILELNVLTPFCSPSLLRKEGEFINIKGAVDTTNL
jgi:hypothetical protein